MLENNDLKDGKFFSAAAGLSLRKALERLKTIPGASVVIEAVRSWWAQHPLRVAGMLASDAAELIVQPVARRNPLGLMLGAAVVGGLLTWSRPWRWVIKPALFAGLLPQLFSTVLAHLPVHSWLGVLTAMVQEQRSRGNPPPSGKPAAKKDAPD